MVLCQHQYFTRNICMDMYLTKTSGLTKAANGIVGKKFVLN